MLTLMYLHFFYPIFGIYILILYIEYDTIRIRKILSSSLITIYEIWLLTYKDWFKYS